MKKRVTVANIKKMRSLETIADKKKEKEEKATENSMISKNYLSIFL